MDTNESETLSDCDKPTVQEISAERTESDTDEEFEEDGSDEEGSDEDGSDEDGSDEDGSDEEESSYVSGKRFLDDEAEEVEDEESDEDKSDDDGSDEDNPYYVSGKSFLDDEAEEVEEEESGEDDITESSVSVSSDDENLEEEINAETSKPCEVYSKYTALSNNLGKPHPQPLCEGSGLSCVAPPSCTYTLKMDPSKFNNGYLSHDQIDAVRGVCQAHSQEIFLQNPQTLKYTAYRKGFLIGDGTGTGKTRILAASLFEFALSQPDAIIWLTASQGLFESIESEVKYFMPTQKFLRIENLTPKEGKLHPNKSTNSDVGHNILLVTYKGATENLRQILQWLGNSDFSGMLIFDEAHMAKAAEDCLKKSQTGQAVLKLQNMYPKARVVYATATVASEPHHLLVMTRLGIWGKGEAFANSETLRSKLKQGDVKMLELLAIEMKMNGSFLARQISFENVELSDVPVKASALFNVVYERSAQMWRLMFLHLKILKTSCQTNGDNDTLRDLRRITATVCFCQIHFFMSLIMSSKVKEAASIAKKCIKPSEQHKDGMAAIIGLQNTGQAQFQAFFSERWTKGQPFSNAAYILRHALRLLNVPIGCPKLYRKDDSYAKIGGDWTEDDDKTADKDFMQPTDEEEDVSQLYDDTEDNDVSNTSDALLSSAPLQKKLKLDNDFEIGGVPKYSLADFWGGSGFDKERKNLSWSLQNVKDNVTAEGLGRMYHELCPLLPINPMDELVHRLGKKNLSMLTGSKFVYCYNESRQTWNLEQKHENQEEMDAFMNMQTKICIISSAGSVGYSLHADKNKRNNLPRKHISLQYPFSPDKYLQQLGRSHRSNQVCPPQYVILRSPIPAEERFIAVIAKRLRQLGAICHGQALATPLASGVNDVMYFSVGQKAIITALRSLRKNQEIASMLDSIEMTLSTSRKATSVYANNNITRCLNRSLMLPISIQERFYNNIKMVLETERLKDPSQFYSPIIDIPTGDTDITLTDSYKLDLGNGKDVTVYTFMQSRIAEIKMIRDIAKQAGESKCTWYMVGSNSVCLAVENENQSIDCYYPFSRTKKSVVKSELQRAVFSKTTQVAAIARWENLVRNMKKNPGCFHKAIQHKFSSCSRSGCLFNWGLYEFKLLAGFTTPIWDSIGMFTNNESFTLARVNYEEKCGVQTRVVGLLLSQEKGLIIEENLLKKYMKIQ